MTYIINWSDDGIKTPLTVGPLEENTTDTSLVLFGAGALNYGETLQENFIRLLENFASDTAPVNPTVGQLWFDTSINTLKAYDGVDFVPQGVANVQPASPLNGSLFYDNVGGELQVWDGVAWQNVARINTNIQAAQTSLNNHKNDIDKHLTAEQNTILDNIGSVTGADLNALENVTSNIQVQLDNKIDKVAGATAGNIAIQTADGNLADSGKSVSDIASESGTYSKAESDSQIGGDGEFSTFSGLTISSFVTTIQSGQTVTTSGSGNIINRGGPILTKDGTTLKSRRTVTYSNCNCNCDCDCNDI